MNITIFENTYKAYTCPDAMLDIPWEEIVALLTDFRQVRRKEEAMMFNLWKFNPNGTLGRHYHDDTKLTWDEVPNSIRRCSENAISVSGLVLDYDGKNTIEDAMTELDGFEYALYTSFRHTDELHKFRVVLPFTRPLSKQEFRLKQENIKEVFPNVDNASFAESQAFFLHSGPNQANAAAIHVQGVMLDPSIFTDSEEPERPGNTETTNPEFTELTPQQRNNYQTTILASLRTCSGIRRGSAKGTGGLLLAAICKASGFTFDNFRELIPYVCPGDSTMHDNKEQIALWNSVKEDQHITKEVRDKFILDHNGTLPVFTRQPSLNDIFHRDSLLNRLF
jgi:hypothetical protein